MKLVEKKTIKSCKEDKTSVGEILQALTMFLVPQFDFASFQYLPGIDGSFFHPINNNSLIK